MDYVGGGDIGVINYHASWILNLHDGEIKWCECLIGKKEIHEMASNASALLCRHISYPIHSQKPKEEQVGY